MYQTISMRELEQWIAYGRPMYLVDLRRREQYHQGHLMGAVNIPFEELEEYVDEMPKTVPTVFYCGKGSKSILACNRLANLGYPVVNTGCGLVAYRGKYLVR